MNCVSERNVLDWCKPGFIIEAALEAIGGQACRSSGLTARACVETLLPHAGGDHELREGEGGCSGSAIYPLDDVEPARIG